MVAKNANVAISTLFAASDPDVGDTISHYQPWALGHAATQSASLVESLGSMAKSLGVGNAAKNGLAAALFAASGFTGPATPIEGRYGFAPGQQ